MITTDAAASPTRGAPAAHQTLRILTHLSRQRGPVPASAVAHALDLPRSTVYRLLGVMEEHGFVVHYPEDRRYGIGVAAFELSSGFSRQEPLARLGAPILASLVDKVGESAHLAVLSGRDVVYIVEERAAHRPRLVTDVGVRLPSHITASGRALLAALPPSQLRAVFPNAAAFARRTDDDAYSLRELKAVLTQVRQQGFAGEDGDVTDGFASVAVAVRDHAGWPAAAIAITFPRDHVSRGEWPTLAADLGRYAGELSRRIRGRPQ
ncbi:IclR family transcriptional regulator [Curtobacterium sp. ISL-83]|uniref:IclR family transcriptional regulator n=1 Tax=Curtobacterium sp. ISL-83 TaxID=2819145 RepID=UPI001BEC10C7|nr:IclR family transcriptional regulator [Curtobacterium sp. ISL-83]MBT2501110.1 IclR family transcriptional regulator [Curtobacterium sp. ISL-83]